MNLSLSQITLQYDDKILFTDVSLDIHQGDFVVVRGASGSGKTSFLRLLNRLGEPTTGAISVDDQPASAVEVTTYRRRVGYVQQIPILVSGTVYENLTLPFRYKSSKEPAPSRDRLKSDLDDFNLGDVRLDDCADSLSVGQKQRIALIRTLLTNPYVILGDEPTSALDPESRALVEERLRQVNRDRNTTVVLVTHLEFDQGDRTARQFTIDGSQLREVPA